MSQIRVTLAGVLLLALMLRLVALAVPSMHHPDEVYQYLEPAHRLVFGYGVETWEWRYGMRSWLAPMLLAVPMQVGAWLAPEGALYLVLPKLAMVGASLAVVATGWKMGARVSRTHAIVAGVAAATWYEFVYFAPHVLSETMSLALILPATFILSEQRTQRNLMLAGALLAIAAVLRFQHLPAIGAVVLVTCSREFSTSWRPLFTGALIGLVPAALADASMARIPFAWFFENIRLNLVEDRAAGFGTTSVFEFAAENWRRFGPWIVPLVVFAAIGARRYPAFAVAALVNLAFHMMIGHKEYRFILLSSTILILLAAIGVAGWMRGDRRRMTITALCWLVATIGIGAGSLRAHWTRAEPELALSASLRNNAALCGIAIYRHDFFRTGGYSYLHRNVPMHVFRQMDAASGKRSVANEGPAFDTILASPRRASELPAGYDVATCRGAGADRVCLYRRSGPCIPAANSPSAIQAQLLAVDG